MADPPSSGFLVRGLPSGYYISNVSPRLSWNPSTNVIKASKSRNGDTWPLLEVKSRSSKHRIIVLLGFKSNPLLIHPIPQGFIARNPRESTLNNLRSTLKLTLSRHWSRYCAPCGLGSRLQNIHTRPVSICGTELIIVDIGLQEARCIFLQVLYEQGVSVIYFLTDHFHQSQNPDILDGWRGIYCFS